jgi:predicted  nucleic acid-binding Zn-ribbon protein
MHDRFRKDLVRSREGLASLDARLDTIQVALDAAESAIAVLQEAGGGGGDYDDEISALQSSVSALQSDVSDIQDEIDALQGVVHEDGYVQLNTSLEEVDIPTAAGAFYWNQEDSVSRNSP